MFSLQFCSDSEDLFGDYDSLLDDSSLLAKLDAAEHNERQRDVLTSAHGAADQKDFTALRPITETIRETTEQKQRSEVVLSDSVLDQLGDEPFEDLPPSQILFQEQMKESVKRSRLQEKTSTPSRSSERSVESKRTARRRSVAEQLKKTMLCNAASPSCVSRSAVLKDAVVSKEISVAMQAMESVSSQTTDLGPFFGLPSRVRELMFRLRGIQTLYGDLHL